MKDFLKKNLTLVIAFSLPILLIIIVGLSSILPSLWLKTNYNFVYAICENGSNYYYDCDNYLNNLFSVEDGGLVVNEMSLYQDSDRDGIPDIQDRENYTARIFLHDTEKNITKEISLQEAQSLNLNELITSPDGVTVSNQYDRGANFFPLFDGGSSYGFYLTKGNSKTKLNLVNSDDRYYYYRDNFKFIGWVLPGRN